MLRYESDYNQIENFWIDKFDESGMKTKEINVEIDQWDFGDEFHPHLIKLVPSSGDQYNWGFYCVVYYDTNFKVFTGGLTTTGTFRLVNPMRAATFVENAIYDVFASKGIMSLTSRKAEVVFDFAFNCLTGVTVATGSSPKQSPTLPKCQSIAHH